MKNNFFLIAFIAMSLPAFAQKFEFKTRPISAILLKKYQLGLEYGINDHFGLEFEPRGAKNAPLDFLETKFKYNALGANLMAKYYVSPKKKYDRFSTGIYLNAEKGTMKAVDSNAKIKGLNATEFAIGGIIGYKWVVLQDAIIECNLGLGRALIRKYTNTVDASDTVDLSTEKFLNLDAIMRISVGYRLGSWKNK